jgi:2-iminobutanoate/2-iminopropanoate deaminase
VAEKSVVRTESAPAPFQGAPYSQAIVVGDLVFVAGQVGTRPGTSELVGASIEQQTEQACENVKAILEEAGSGFEKAVKTTVFLDDFGEFGGMNDVYARYVGDRPPARSTVEVAALPMGAKVEIEVVAHL